MKQAKTKHITVAKREKAASRFKEYRKAKLNGTWVPKKNLSLYRLPFRIWVMKSVVKLDSKGREVPGDFERRLARGETQKEKINHRLYKAINATSLRQFLVNDWRMVIGGLITYKDVANIIKHSAQIPATIRILQFYDDKTEEFLSMDQVKEKITKMEI